MVLTTVTRARGVFLQTSLKVKGSFGNVVLITLFVFFWKYVWMKKCVKTKTFSFSK